MIIGKTNLKSDQKIEDRMLWLVKKPINRREKREAKHEQQKIIKRLGDVQYRFFNQCKDGKFPNDKLYLFYLKQYQDNCKYIARKVNPKYFCVNEFYFTTLKNSVEN